MIQNAFQCPFNSIQTPILTTQVNFSNLNELRSIPIQSGICSTPFQIVNGFVTPLGTNNFITPTVANNFITPTVTSNFVSPLVTSNFISPITQQRISRTSSQCFNDCSNKRRHRCC